MLKYIFIDNNALESKPSVLLSMTRASDRTLIRKNMPEHFDVIEEPASSFQDLNYDLCITDLPSYKANRKELLDIKKKALPVFLPILLLVQNSKALKHHPEIWNEIDDVVEVPVPMNMLNMRIKNQLRTRKNSLQIAKQNEKLRILEKAINSTNVGVLITDAQAEDNPIIFANRGFTKLTGYSEEEILGKNCRFLQNDDRDQEGVYDIHEFIQDGEPGRSIIRNYKKDGTPFWNELSVAPVKNTSDEVTHFVGIQNDVSKLLETQQELKEEKELLRLVTENSTDMISRHTLDGTYLFVTSSCEQLMGYNPDELIGRNAFDFIHPEDREKVDKAHKVLHDDNEGANTVTVTCRKRTKTGDYKWVEIVSRASVNPENNTIVEVQANTRDITKRKQYEHDLEDSVKEKNVLLQEVHHRVKNNLAIISGLLQIHQFDTNNEHLYKILGNSISRIKSMALIHEKLYNSKSLSHLEFKEYIEDLILSIKKSQDYSNKIDIHIDCDNIVLNVNQAVPCALILNEAISNAIEHAFPDQEKGTIWVKFKKKDNRILVSIKDDGIGIPDSVLESKKPSMGMTIIQTLVKQLNAEKEFSNNNGTELKFSFNPQDVKGAHNQFL